MSTAIATRSPYALRGRLDVTLDRVFTWFPEHPRLTARELVERSCRRFPRITIERRIFGSRGWWVTVA